MSWSSEETAPFATAWREAIVLRVVDGDTLDLRVDLGFDVHVATRIRLMAEGLALTPDDKSDDSVDAYETRGAEREAGLAAKARAEELAAPFTLVRIYSAKGGSRGKYGRWLACVLYRKGDTWWSLADVLIAEGHATP